MKTILITIENGFIARNLLQTDFLKYLKEIPELRIVLLVPASKLEFYRKTYGADNVIIDLLPPEPPLTRLEIIASILGTNSISTNTQKIKHYRYVYNKKRPLIKRILVFIRGRFLWHLGKFNWWRNFVRSFYDFLPAGSHYDRIFKQYKPDLVYATNLLRFEEFRLLKQAKKRGIKTAAEVLTWDNLSSKLFIFSKADKFIVPINLVKEELIRYVNCCADDIFVSGIPQYDYYFRKDFILSKEEFFHRIGADPFKKLILYACSGKGGSPNYFEIFEQLNEIIIDKKIKDPVQVIIRPYPKYNFSGEEKKKILNYNFILDEPVTYIGNQTENNWDFVKENIVHLANLLYHCNLVVTAYSTMVIDAMVFGKPVININFDGYQNKPYLYSVKRIRHCEHYQNIINAGAERAANNKEELAKFINEYLANPVTDEDGRKKVVVQQCGFTDGMSGRRKAEILYNFLTADNLEKI